MHACTAASLLLARATLCAALAFALSSLVSDSMFLRAAATRFVRFIGSERSKWATFGRSWTRDIEV